MQCKAVPGKFQVNTDSRDKEINLRLKQLMDEVKMIKAQM
jgi:hypothetical protein